MALARGVRLRDDHAFEQRKATILAVLDDLAPASVDDSGRREEVRRFQVELDAREASSAAVPEASPAAQARFRYLEWWSRDGRGWRLAKYQYDYFDRVRGGRLAYHRHDLAGGSDILHVHCEPSGRPRAAPHFRSYEVDLLEAHGEFAGLYLGGRTIDCTGLRPLRLGDD